ncbi:MAG: hypothetical protein ACRDP5_12285 [Streptosporangiaceae bacterium]
MSELTSELQRMADDAARQARPPAAAEIIRQGDRRRRRSLTRQSLGGLSAAGVVGAGVALGLGLTGSAPAHTTGTIRTAAFTLVNNADGTATLTINNNVLFDPGTLQSDLGQDGIPAKVTVGSFCSSDPAPASASQVVSVANLQPGEDPTVTIDPRAMPAGTELSFGNFQVANGGRTFLAVIDTGSYTCTSTAPTGARGDAAFGFYRSPSR